MALWNVIVPATAAIEARDAADATDRLRRALDRAGFVTYDAHDETVYLTPFEAEEDTEPFGLPGI